MSALWSLLALPILATLALIAYYLWNSRSEEHRKLRREGAEVITPARELVNGLGPEGIMFGSDEQVSAYLSDCFNKWWNGGMRARLMIYLNHHPSRRVRELGEQFAVMVGITLASTKNHFLIAEDGDDDGGLRAVRNRQGERAGEGGRATRGDPPEIAWVASTAEVATSITVSRVNLTQRLDTRLSARKDMPGNWLQ